MKFKNYLFLIISFWQCSSPSGIDFLVKPKYDDVKAFSEGYAAVRKNDKWGYIDSTGKEIIPLQYEKAFTFNQGLAEVQKIDEKGNKLCGIIDKEGNTVIPLKYLSVGDGGSIGNFIIVQTETQSFLFDREEKKLTSKGYDKIRYRPNTKPVLECYIDNKCGLISFQGEEICPVQYDAIESFHQGFARVWNNEKMGFINEKGEEVIPCIYDLMPLKAQALSFIPSYFPKGLAVAKYNDKYGFINEKGEEVIPFQYTKAFTFYKAFAIVCKDTLCGCIDETGNEIIPIQFLSVVYIDNNLLAVKIAGEKDTQWSFINEKGEPLTPIMYDNFGRIGADLIAVRKGRYWGFIDYTGREIVPCQYNDTHNFGRSHAEVQKIDKKGHKLWGIIDKTGKEIVPCQYEAVKQPSYHELGWIKHKEKWALINQKGEILSPFKYDELKYIGSTDLLQTTVYVANSEGGRDIRHNYLDTLGNEIFPIPDYGGDRLFLEGVLAVEKDDKWGFVNEKGELVVPIIFDQVRDSENGFIAVRVDREWGFIRNPEKQ